MQRIAALFISALVITACDSNPEPTDPAVDSTPRAEVPTPEPITLGTDAFDGITALVHLPSGADLALATTKPAELASSLALEPTREDEGLGANPPALSDVHPESLKALGLDPKAPVALVRYTGRGDLDADLKEHRQWAFVAKIGDRTVLEEALGAPQTLAFPEPKEGAEAVDDDGVMRKIPREVRAGKPAKINVWETDDGWAVVAPEYFRFAPSRDASLATETAFMERRKALKYGGLATVWMKRPQSDSVAIGLDIEGERLGLRAVSTTNEDAAAAIGKAPAHVGSGILSATASHKMILGLMTGNQKSRELEKEIEKAEAAPRIRQIEQMTAAVENRALERVDSDDAYAETLPADALATLQAAWADAAMTEDEAKAIEEMEKRLEKLEAVGIASIFGDGELSKSFSESLGSGKGIDFGEIARHDVEMGSSEGFGGLGMRGGGGGGDRGKGTIGGLAPRRTEVVTVAAADSAVKPHASRKVSRVKRCFGPDAPKAPFKVTARVSTDADGKVSVGSVSGANSKVQSCVKRALGGVAPEKDVSGSITYSFVLK